VKFVRLDLGILLLMLLLGGALSSARTTARRGASKSNTFLTVIGVSAFGDNGGQFAIYPLVGGIPQDVKSPYLYRISGAPGNVTVDPTAKRLYVSATTSGTNGNDSGGILGFRYNGQPSLTKLMGFPFQTQAYEYGLAGDYAGGFLYASNYLNNDIFGFQIATNGGLGQQLPGSPFPDGQQPASLVFDAQDGFLYSANNGTISGSQVNASTGTLDALPGSPYASGSILARISHKGLAERDGEAEIGRV
jgi:6-phosphogluconolactonase (cycloisomerase 2 family)